VKFWDVKLGGTHTNTITFVFLIQKLIRTLKTFCRLNMHSSTLWRELVALREK